MNEDEIVSFGADSGKVDYEIKLKDFIDPK